MPLFSTIIPTLNRSDLLVRTLESIFAQTEPIPEIIIVDDGSTDDTFGVLKKYDSRITLLRQANRGPGAARNLGLQHATGEFIAFLDSDDLWFPWTLAVYRQVIEQNNRPSFIAGKPLRFTQDSELAMARQSTPQTPVEVECFADYYQSGDQWRWYGVSSFIIRRDALSQTTGFSEEPINGEDADLTMKLGVAPGFVQIKSPHTFAYRDHVGNITRQNLKTFRGVSHFLDSEITGAYPGGPERRERRRILTRHSRPASISLIQSGLPREARYVYRKTFAWNLRQFRIKYLLAFPWLLAKSRLTPRNPRNP